MLPEAEDEPAEWRMDPIRARGGVWFHDIDPPFSGHRADLRQKGSAMSLARLVVTAVRIEGRTKAEVSRDYGVSPRWVYELCRRFDSEGEPDSSLAPGGRGAVLSASLKPWRTRSSSSARRLPTRGWMPVPTRSPIT